MAFVGHLPDGEIKKTLHYHVYTSCFQIIGGSLSAVITFHNTENKPKKGICVANHTSPIDVLILACDNAYALVSNVHGYNQCEKNIFRFTKFCRQGSYSTVVQ